MFTVQEPYLKVGNYRYKFKNNVLAHNNTFPTGSLYANSYTDGVIPLGTYNRIDSNNYIIIEINNQKYIKNLNQNFYYHLYTHRTGSYIESNITLLCSIMSNLHFVLDVTSSDFVFPFHNDFYLELEFVQGRYTKSIKYKADIVKFYNYDNKLLLHIQSSKLSEPIPLTYLNWTRIFFRIYIDSNVKINNVFVGYQQIHIDYRISINYPIYFNLGIAAWGAFYLNNDDLNKYYNDIINVFSIYDVLTDVNYKILIIIVNSLFKHFGLFSKVNFPIDLIKMIKDMLFGE